MVPIRTAEVLCASKRFVGRGEGLKRASPYLHSLCDELCPLPSVHRVYSCRGRFLSLPVNLGYRHEHLTKHSINACTSAPSPSPPAWLGSCAKPPGPRAKYNMSDIGASAYVSCQCPYKRHRQSLPYPESPISASYSTPYGVGRRSKRPKRAARRGPWRSGPRLRMQSRGV